MTFTPMVPVENGYVCLECGGEKGVAGYGTSVYCVKCRWVSMVSKATVKNPHKPYQLESNEWMPLFHEPCRYCRNVGCVYVMVDDGPEGRVGLSPCRCDRCKRTWVPGESSA